MAFHFQKVIGFVSIVNLSCVISGSQITQKNRRVMYLSFPVDLTLIALLHYVATA